MTVKKAESKVLTGSKSDVVVKSRKKKASPKKGTTKLTRPTKGKNSKAVPRPQQKAVSVRNRLPLHVTGFDGSQCRIGDDILFHSHLPAFESMHGTVKTIKQYGDSLVEAGIVLTDSLCPSEMGRTVFVNGLQVQKVKKLAFTQWARRLVQDLFYS